MIDEIDKKLQEWVGSVLEDAPVSFEAPRKQREGAGVNLYLLELSDAPPPRGRYRTPLQVNLRYLVTAWATDPQQEHRLLGELVFAAYEREGMEVDFKVPHGLWTALDLPPRPAFILEMPLRRERPEPHAPRVRQPLVTQMAPSIALTGQVLGPGDLPIAGALVELPGHDLRTEADPDGRFRFPRVLADTRPRIIRVRAKGEVRSFTVSPTALGEPLTIRFPLED